MIEKNDIWIFLPAFNEATVIKGVIQRIKNCGYSNIVIIDDGSEDETYQFAIDEGTTAMRLCINRGVGAAIRTGILYAKRKGISCMVFLDADGQHYPEDIDKIVLAMQQNQADVVIGSRFLEEASDIPFKRVIFNKIANFLTYFGRMSVTDSQSGFRLLNKKAINTLDLELDRYGICTEMVWKTRLHQLKLVETPIRVRYTEYSMSKGQNLWRGIKTAVNLLKKLIR